MKAARTRESVEALFCWEQVSETNPLFRVSQKFAAPSTAGRLLPLYALFSVLEQLCTEISEQEVALRKLNWWREECLLRDVSASDHPILREFQVSGAAACLARSELACLLDGVESWLDSPAPDDLDALQDICTSVGMPQLQLEFGVCGLAHESASAFPGMASVNGLVQLLRGGNYWWVPLKLLARHGVVRSEIKNHPEPEKLRKLFAEILAAGTQWENQGGSDAASGIDQDSMARHAFVLNALYMRKLKRMGTRNPADIAGELNHTRIADLVTAWKVARRVSRQ